MGNWYFGPQSDHSWVVRWGEVVGTNTDSCPQCSRKSSSHMLAWSQRHSQLQKENSEPQTSSWRGALAGSPECNEDWREREALRTALQRRRSPESPLEKKKKKGKISAVVQPWLLKRAYIIAWWSRTWPLFDVPRVRESVPGWAEPEPQLPGQIGIQRYQM